MKNNFKYFICCGIVMFSSFVHCQINDPGNDGGNNSINKFKIAVAGIFDGSKIRLRWRPADLQTYNWGVQHGYTVTRTTLVANGDTLNEVESGDTKTIISAQIMPLPIQNWDALVNVNQDDQSAKLGRKILYEHGLDVENISSLSLEEVFAKSQEQKNLFNMAMWTADQNVEIANAFGFYLVDDSIQINSTYIYVISLFDVDESVESKIEGGSAIINSDSIITWPPPSNIGYSRIKKQIQISWKLLDKKYAYSYYDLERSDNNGVNYVKVNDKPILFLSPKDDKNFDSGESYCVDIVPEYKHLYIYRLKGYTPFNTAGPYSDTIHTMAWPDPIIAPFNLDSINESSSDKLIINWRLPIEYNDSIIGVRLMRAKSENGRYAIIDSTWLPSTVRSFTDLHPYGVNYYAIEYKDINENISYTSHIVGQALDTIAPSVYSPIIDPLVGAKLTP